VDFGGNPNGWRGHALRRGLSVVAVLAVTSVAIDAMRQHRVALGLIDRLDHSAARAQIQDRLIGQRLDLSALLDDGVGEGQLDARTVLWVVDLEECVGCFDSVVSWARLESARSHNLALVLIGETTPSVEARLRGLTRTRVQWAERKQVEALRELARKVYEQGAESKFDKLRDSRYSGQDCGWIFDAQVGALAGVNEAHRIRADAAEVGETIQSLEEGE